jgi:hypothetical protein
MAEFGYRVDPAEAKQVRLSATADVVNEHVLRGVAQRWDWREQMRMWKQLEGALGKSAEVLREERAAGPVQDRPRHVGG